MEVVEFGALTPELRAELEGDEPDPFEAEGIPMQFVEKQRHVALRNSDGRLVASTGMVVVEVEVAGERFPIVGFGGVIVSAPHRGQGLGRGVVQAALARAQSMGPAFVLLFCHSSRAGLYRRLDFVRVTSPVSVEQPGGTAEMPLHTMWRALAPGASWPPGPLAVRSLPF
jgi:GNAT superfamily N-acetyltransferase